MSAPWIDGGVYPDTTPPQTLGTFAARVDFIARLCAAWDFGRLPDAAVVNEIRTEAWRDVVEACRLLTSPTYHLLRRWHKLPVMPYLGRQLAYIRDDPSLAYV